VARIRSIKIDLFLDDGLESVSLEAHFLLAGLPVLADRAGRLEDKPKRIHAQIFPYRPSIDTAALLVELEQTGHIRRYEVAGVRYIEVSGWDRDQRPHVNEPKSTIPAPQPDSTAHCHSHAQGIHELNHGIQAHEDRDGIKDSGLRILDLGCGDLPGIASAQPAPEKDAAPRGQKRPAKPRNDAPPADPRHAPLSLALVALAWPHHGGRTAKALKELLALADQSPSTAGDKAQAEILRRAAKAKASTGFPQVREIHELATHWGHFAGPSASPASALPKADDPDWVTV
jgi:hypothetical protein